MSSRVARKPIIIPKGVEISIKDQLIEVKGSKGTLQHVIPTCVAVSESDSELIVQANDELKSSNALAGTTRALVNNCIIGVSEGYEKKLTLKGVGYRAQVKGNVLHLTLGFSHPVEFKIPEGITIECPSQTDVVVVGNNKQKVGQVAANIRAYRPPEPYKGKGIRYADEVVLLKETKKK